MIGRPFGQAERFSVADGVRWEPCCQQHVIKPRDVSGRTDIRTVTNASGLRDARPVKPLAATRRNRGTVTTSRQRIHGDRSFDRGDRTRR